jgi:hypothetical protein
MRMWLLTASAYLKIAIHILICGEWFLLTVDEDSGYVRIVGANGYFSPSSSPLDRIDCCGYKNHEHIDTQKAAKICQMKWYFPNMFFCSSILLISYPAYGRISNNE